MKAPGVLRPLRRGARQFWSPRGLCVLLALASVQCSGGAGKGSDTTPAGQGGEAQGGPGGQGGQAGQAGQASAGKGGAAAGSDQGTAGSKPGGISVMVSPTVAHALPSATVQFGATVSGSSDSAVSWAVKEGAAGGTISGMGLYSAPSAAGTYHVVVTSHALASATATATVVVASVGDCSKVAAAGTWENISPVVADPANTTGVNYSDAIVVDPFDSATLWSGTGYAGIFKSTDCGSTWTHVNTGRNGKAIDQSAAGSMAVDPLNHGVIYTTAFDGANGLFKSTNGGVDWDQLFPAGSDLAKYVQYALVNSIAMDANDPSHLVVAMHAACLPPYGVVCEAESKDAGATWAITTVPVGTPDWAPGAGAFILGPTTWLFGTYSAGLWLTEDSGANWKNVTPTGATGSTAGKTLVLPFSPNVKDGKYYLPAMEGIIQSSKDGKQWSLLPNSGGRAVGFVIGADHMYAADQWSTNMSQASNGDPTSWSTFAPAMAWPDGAGSPYLAYDHAHHLLYASKWPSGLWRVATP